MCVFRHTLGYYWEQQKIGKNLSKKLGLGKDACWVRGVVVCFVLSATWLPHCQLWVIIERTAQLIQYLILYVILFFLTKKLRLASWGRVLKPGWVLSGVWMNTLKAVLQEFNPRVFCIERRVGRKRDVNLLYKTISTMLI